MIEEERRNLRYTLRQARRKLTEVQQARAADNLRELVTNQDFYRKALQIAFYQSVDGEIDPTPLLKQALSEGKSCCLPTIPDKNSELISFAPFNEDTVLRKTGGEFTSQLLPRILFHPLNLIWFSYLWLGSMPIAFVWVWVRGSMTVPLVSRYSIAKIHRCS